MIEISSSEEFKIIPYTKKYYDDWIDLFEKTTKRKRHGNFYRYNTASTPYGKPIRFLMKHKKKIIGSHSIRPIQYRIKDEIVLGGMTHDSLVDPEYQGMGIFTELVTATQAKAKKQNYQFVCGFANSNSIEIYHKKLYHTKFKPINLIKITDFKKEKLPNPITFGLSKKSESQLCELKSMSNEKQFTCTIDKDLKYFTWRYYKKHHEAYRVFCVPGSFFIISKRFEQQEQIVDFMAINEQAFREALSVIAHTAKTRSHTNDITMWISPKHHLLKESSINYEVLTPKQHFHILSFNDNLTKTLLDSYNWNYSMGDSDVF